MKKLITILLVLSLLLCSVYSSNEQESLRERRKLARRPLVKSQFSIIFEDIMLIFTDFFNPGAWFRLFGDTMLFTLISYVGGYVRMETKR